ncbi:hypothetical protein EKD00_09195 [Chlorobium phaeovibrioides]|uniref:hypothetical protein n=1 Tax=Chlorobium phaeovibrioides TaxID=1094 RepID=UPI000F836679|nr:hypothetical protein [Chlorobium phaeovibrioides]RTY33696.1 hypothetical protein EKD00_09195 [Chlorobium phaeovibrioides]
MTTNTSGARSLSSLLGMVPTLPGESQEQYRLSLDALLEELGATTVLQVYLAEKIHDCLWWIHRYSAQKRITLIAEMAALADGSHYLISDRQEHIRTALLSQTTDKKTTATMKAKGHTLESMQQEAMAKQLPAIVQLDQQIALQNKILAGFQRSYELAFNRKLYVERMELQNELLRRDAGSIRVQGEAPLYE